MSYTLVTPARNEAQFIELTIRSVIAQTVVPAKWVIVSDGSTDGTDQIVKKYNVEYPWIELVQMPERRERHFGAKVEAFDAGYGRLKALRYSVVGNLDADITIGDTRYFEFLLRKFAENPRLGVCGTAYIEDGVKYPSRFTSVEDVFGACQMFRRECFEAVGGYLRLESGGIDLIAFLRAREKGWQTRTFTEKVCIHHRKVGSAQHSDKYERLLQTGRKDYMLGSHPLWQLARCVYVAKSRPYVVGGALTLLGYLIAMLGGVERTMPEDLVKLRQEDQMRRLRYFLLHPGLKFISFIT